MDQFRVLLVDDEEELVTTIVERLGYRGWTAKYALGGQEALQIMKNESFDIVVLDLKMPGMSGEQVFEKMQESGYKLPVLMITGHGGYVEEEGEQIDGIADYIAKPINLEDLIAKMLNTIRSSNAL
ncbi:MAG: response regulator [Calditrichaeota bacterium]|nr:response regulator [Calditrichota bacterium]